jgi:hypothetical protein
LELLLRGGFKKYQTKQMLEEGEAQGKNYV